MTDTSWQNRVTLLVNSCDAYADLWQPFFTLLKRYFVPLPAEILLNTETKDFAFDGLNLRCVHSTAPTYGERMTDALREVKTEYTLLLLDDFFLRPEQRTEERLQEIGGYCAAGGHRPLDGRGSGHRLFQQRRDRRGV